ncbi:MAG: LuxR C-terminal-related transcriptional regulator [Intrasporangium sp.]|uniref:LuxR C-terminal-related transcriptional regulator n=1 Tax=Intrasporangium sp. TaxID=1925024 RepID=UPI00264717A0|nr:LuxR C-terminal-related transcriptional regulator [Intrasporangium sp.]MDN5797661.1 LuxR C-terminal-related transcriptional regulator [Intrasporangium sp.]
MTSMLSEAALRALRHADQLIQEADRGDVFAVYDTCRATLGSIAALDDFYVALINEADRRISYPYLFSNGRYEEGGTVTYAPNGLTAWVIASRRPYRYADDEGALLNRGYRFGDGEPSADTVVVPLLGSGDGAVIGLMSALSDTADAFTDETVRAMEWLAGLVVDRLRANHPTRGLNLPLVYPELDDAGRSGTLMALNTAGNALTRMAQELTALAEAATDEHLAERLAELSRRCFGVQAQLVTRLGPKHDAPVDPLQGLSPRERAVAELVTGPDGDPGNAGIAAALGISPATVKTHMSSLLDKLGLEHRSELRWVVGHARRH